MPRRASIGIATGALLGVALAGQAIAGDGTVGQKVTIARGQVRTSFLVTGGTGPTPSACATQCALAERGRLGERRRHM